MSDITVITRRKEPLKIGDILEVTSVGKDATTAKLVYSKPDSVVIGAKPPDLGVSVSEGVVALDKVR